MSRKVEEPVVEALPVVAVPIDPAVEQKRSAILAAIEHAHGRARGHITVAPDASTVEIDGKNPDGTVAGPPVVWRVLEVRPYSIVAQLVDPRDHDVALAVATELHIPPAVEAPAPTTGIDPVREIHRARALLDRVRHVAERCRTMLRSVAGGEGDEVGRLMTLAPLDAHDSGLRPLGVDIPLLQLTRAAVETRAVVAELRAALDAARAFAVEVAPGVKAALIAVEAAKRGRGTVADIRPLDVLGEVLSEQLSNHERALDDLEHEADRLRLVVAEVGGLFPLFDSASRTHVRAVLTVTRQIGVAVRSAALDKLESQAHLLQAKCEWERLAEEAVADLDVSDVPTIVYGADPLTRPRLA